MEQIDQAIWSNIKETDRVPPYALAYVDNSNPCFNRTCKSRFCPVRVKVQVDKWVADMNRLFPNCPYFHITCTLPS
uniref:Transposase zinc-binding domain-containing protein n=1 Tax=Candidatus Kentrum sp. TC TaxID=2126339 RepID=A0A450YZW4_9GAMM|nr:MAG: Transposase zinc-binding domain-containing protein [Candidatus Kentron sp. TC]